MTPSPYADRWSLDPRVVFLNHGSFGACPKVVLEAQSQFRAEMEAQPRRFLVRRLETMLDAVRGELSGFLGVDPQDLVFVSNATMGVNAILRSLPLEPGDELLTTCHEYNACNNAMRFVAERTGARVVVADVPFPIGGDARVVETVMQAVTPRTKLAMFSHVTSATGVIFPVEAIVRELRSRGVRTLVDGAHAPGMIPLDIRSLGADYYTGNFHKWVCAPKGAAFLWVRRELQPEVRPTVISHAYNARRVNRSRYLMEFDWTGTGDPTPWLCIPHAINFISTLMPGGLEALRVHNHTLALKSRDLLCKALDTTPPCPEEMIGSLVTVRLPDEPYGEELTSPRAPMPSPTPALQDALLEKYNIEVPIVCWPQSPVRWVRVAAQAYNTLEQVEFLCHALKAELIPPGSPTIKT